MTRRTIGLDIDGVLADYTASFLVSTNSLLGVSLSYDDMRSHDLADCWGVTAECMHEAMLYFEQPGIIASLPPIPGALEAVARLSERYDIVLITGRNPKWEQETWDWALRYLPMVENIYFTDGKNNRFAGQHGRESKQVAAERLGAMCLVEDNEQEFHFWNSATVEAICFAQPWNLSIAETHPQFLRLTWEGIVARYIK